MIQTSSVEELLKSKSEPLNFTLKGLLKGHIGMLIAAPGIGKSHLALCLAIEHASTFNLLGMSSSQTAKKTLVINSEDSKGVVKERMKEKLSSLPPKVRKEVNKNLHFLNDLHHLVIPPESSIEDKKQHSQFITELIEVLKGFELVIVDTVTESIGECCEVKHDRLIKNTFQALAKKSDCAILLVHHVNKDEIRGSQKVTMASGAGLTSIMRLTKCLFTISSKDKGSSSITFLKSNYLNERESIEIPFEVHNSICISPNVQKESLIKPSRSKRNIVKQEPEAITISGIVDKDSAIEDKKSLRGVL